MGPRASLDRCGKSRFSPGFDPRTVQLVASRYTDYATRPANVCILFNYLMVDYFRPRKLDVKNLSTLSLSGWVGVSLLMAPFERDPESLA